jgi:hypothetical protein
MLTIFQVWVDKILVILYQDRKIHVVQLLALEESILTQLKIWFQKLKFMKLLKVSIREKDLSQTMI